MKYDNSFPKNPILKWEYLKPNENIPNYRCTKWCRDVLSTYFNYDFLKSYQDLPRHLKRFGFNYYKDVSEIPYLVAPAEGIQAEVWIRHYEDYSYNAVAISTVEGEERFSFYLMDVDVTKDLIVEWLDYELRSQKKNAVVTNNLDVGTKEAFRVILKNDLSFDQEAFYAYFLSKEEYFSSLLTEKVTTINEAIEDLGDLISRSLNEAFGNSVTTAVSIRFDEDEMTMIDATIRTVNNNIDDSVYELIRFDDERTLKEVLDALLSKIEGCYGKGNKEVKICEYPRCDALNELKSFV